MAATTNQLPPAFGRSEEDKIIRIAGFHGRFYHNDLPFDVCIGPAVYPDSLEDIKSPTFVNIPTTVTAVVPSTGQYLMTGRMKKLPTELLLMIASLLDMRSSLRLRGVCRLWRVLISNSVEYRTVVNYAANVVASGLKAGYANWLSFPHVYRAMCAHQCEACGNETRAHYVWLFDATRMCADCIFHRNHNFRVVTLASVAQASKWSRARLERELDVLESLEHHKINGRTAKVVKYVDAVRVTNMPNLHVGLGWGDININVGARNMAIAEVAFWDPKTRTSFGPLTCKGCMLAHELL